ncbi:MAG: fibronectin type III domain-containing protein, partial [Gemmatimonadetes bacterium]|nr:fibronectin type III domain-containing protein [Gemmatimonadota bacterium]
MRIRMYTLRRFTIALASAAVVLAGACNSSDSTGPAAPLPVFGLTVAATGSATTRVTFSGRATESYEIERAEGAAGSFAIVNTVATVATDGTQTYNDAGLKVNTAYRYRVTSIKGTLRSAATSEVSATTLAFGSAAATISTDILTSRTFYADTAYLLSGFIHVANGATLTIQPGTTIKGDYATLGSALMIMRGAKIQAVGT